MHLFDRWTRMLRADAHGVLDRLEERSLLLKQHLREAEVEVACKRARIETLDAERLRVGEDAERLAAQVRRLDEDVDLALAGSQRELARFAVRRLLPRREALNALEGRGKVLDERRARLAACLEDQEARLAVLRPRVRAELARGAHGPDLDGGDELASDEEVDLELLRRETPGAAGVPPAEDDR